MTGGLIIKSHISSAQTDNRSYTTVTCRKFQWCRLKMSRLKNFVTFLMQIIRAKQTVKHLQSNMKYILTTPTNRSPACTLRTGVTKHRTDRTGLKYSLSGIKKGWIWLKPPPTPPTVNDQPIAVGSIGIYAAVRSMVSEFLLNKWEYRNTKLTADRK